METKRILIERFLIKAIERLYHDDYVNIKFGVSERKSLEEQRISAAVPLDRVQ